MAFFRQWLLILTALVLGGGPVFAANSREERAFAVAAAEFHDELWSRAETGFAQFVQRFPQSTNVASAVLFQAQARFQQGKFPDTLTLLTDTGNLTRAQAAGLTDQYVYWTGEAQFAVSNFLAAADTLVAVTKDFPDSPLGLRAAVEAAAVYARLGDWPRHDALLEATNGVFQRAAQLDPGNALVVDGQLSRENSKYQQRDYAGVSLVYDLLNVQRPALKPEQEWRGTYIFCQARMAAGDFAAARAAATNLVQIAQLRKNPGWLAVANSALGAALEKLGLLPEAIAAYSGNVTNGVPVEQQQEAVLKIAALASAQNDFTNSVANLEKFLAQFPDAPAAETVGLALGELHLKQFVTPPAATNQLALAREKFEQVLAGDTNSVLAGRAFLGRGWCHWLAASNDAALADFRAATGRLPVSEEQAVAQFKTGDALFVLTNFDGARRSYQAVLDDYQMFPAVVQSLGVRALYQILRADLQLQDEAGATNAMRGLLAKFSASELATNGLLLLGEGLSDFSAPENARAVFQQFEKQFPDSPLQSQAALAVARTFEREQNWPAAITNYADWLEKNPTNDLRPQAEFALALARFQVGDPTNAFQLFSRFVTEHPTNDLAPLAQWWVADDLFRAGNYAGAETNYENIFQNPAWKNSTNLFYQAQLMAGRAAMGRQSFSDAIRYFTRALDTNCPPPLATQVRFACVAALKQAVPADTNSPLANLQTATNLLDQICRSHPADETGDRARGDLGDCVLLLNDFDAATNYYAQVVNSETAGASLRNRAQVGWGLALEKKAALLPASDRNPLLKLALDKYCDALYTTDPVADPFWLKEAGLRALPLMVTLQEGDVNKFFDSLERWLPQLKDSLEKKRAALGAAKN